MTAFTRWKGDADMLQGKGSAVPLSDEKIIELYWVRDEQAIEETDRKYRKYLYVVANNILSDSIDSEECLGDTYLKTWNAIPPTRPRILQAFLTTVLRRCAINRYHKRARKGVIPSEMTVALSEIENCLADEDNVDETIEAKRLGEVISDFVRSLDRRKRYIFMSRYYLAEPIDKIASELMVSRSTVNKDIAYIRDALKEKLISEGYSI